MRFRRFAAGSVAFGLAAAGCGGHSNIDRQASVQLESAVARVRAAAAARDVAGANARLAEVRRMVALFRAHRDLSAAAAARILTAAAAAAVGSDLSLIPTTTTPTTTTPTTTTPTTIPQKPAPPKPGGPPPPAPAKNKDHHGRGGGEDG